MNVYACSITQSCPALCDPMDCSSPGYSVLVIFSGKNTGMSCHFLLQGIFPTQGSNPHLLPWQVGSLSEPPDHLHCDVKVAQSCLILCDPMDFSPPCSFVHGISQARILECIAISSSRGSSRLRDHTRASCKSPALQAYSLPRSHQGNHNTIYLFTIFIVCLPLDNSSSINTGLSVSFVNRLNPNN